VLYLPRTREKGKLDLQSAINSGHSQFLYPATNLQHLIVRLVGTVSLQLRETALEFKPPREVHNPFRIDLGLDLVKSCDVATIYVLQRSSEKRVIDIRCRS